MGQAFTRMDFAVNTKNSSALKLEVAIHTLFWLFIFSAVNVDWMADWFDPSLRPATPPPLSVLVFPFVFYAHSLWAIPRFLNKTKWKIYLLALLLIFVVPELLRSGFLMLAGKGPGFWDEISSKDSFILGRPNVLWMALIFSFAYRFSKDWFIRKHQIELLGNRLSELSVQKSTDLQPLNEKEASELQDRLQEVMNQTQPYLKIDLSLSDLALAVHTTDKKLSTLLNQNMHTNFYDYINSYRTAAFKKGLAEGKLEQLSILGLARQCGFKSKSSFYRAFNKETGMSPSQYIES